MQTRETKNISNHLGNVLTVITDEKRMVVSGNNYLHYESVVVSVTDYSPFGVSLTGRTFRTTAGYRYGFQNQETDKELWDGAVSYKYRIEDVRLGRFFSVDPLYAKYPWNSNYAFSENCNISCVELEGLEKFFAADGAYLGSVGKSVDNYVVGDNSSWTSYKSNESDPTALSNLLKSSSQAYPEKDLTTMLKNWGDVNISKSQSQEYAMMIFQNTLTDQDGTKLKVLMTGTTVTNELKEEVNVNNSRRYAGGVMLYGEHKKDILNSTVIRKGGWKPYVAVHTHPSGGTERQNFSNDDYGWSISNRIPLFLIPYDTKTLKRFDPFNYEKITRHKLTRNSMHGEASFDKEALEKSITEYKIW